MIRKEAVTIFSQLYSLLRPLRSYQIGVSFLIRGLGLIYLLAIISWWQQMDLLVGDSGLTPVARLLDWVELATEQEGQWAFASLPNLYWLTSTSPIAMHTLCAAGGFLALLVIAGFAQGAALLGLWMIYLTTLNTGGVFMNFQWDVLLLEVGFLSLFLCRWEWRSSWINPSALSVIQRVALLLIWYLIAKLMFLSGWVKLAWASPEMPEWWPDCTALSYHYMTQPIPPWTAWWMYQLPDWFHRFTVYPMYGIELILPFAILAGRWGRLVSAIGFIGLMGFIILTGNFTYFNWLTIVLCLPLIHDRFWPLWFLHLLRIETKPRIHRDAKIRRMTRLAFAGPFLILLALLNLHILLTDLHQAPKPLLAWNLSPAWLDTLASRLDPFHLASGYGLFRTMTTQRPEIIIEGSMEGLRWEPYEFRWKVGDPAAPLRFVAPFQPRVAWQFWFAALEGHYHPNSRNAGWFMTLIQKLLTGDSKVKSLLQQDPFPDSLPRFLRARLMRYEFTTMEERKESGNWWKRTVIGEYLPEVTLSGHGKDEISE